MSGDVTIGPVETGVPMTRRWRYPFAALAVGESFAVHADADDLRRIAKSVSVAGWYHARHHAGRKFAVRTIRAESCVRCWRIA